MNVRNSFLIFLISLSVAFFLSHGFRKHVVVEIPLEYISVGVLLLFYLLFRRWFYISDLIGSLVIALLFFIAYSRVPEDMLFIMSTLFIHITLFYTTFYYFFVVRELSIQGFLKEVKLYSFRLDDVAFAVILLLISYVFIAVVNYAVLEPLGLADLAKVRNVLERLPVYVLVGSVIVAPITEELFFRGLLLRITNIHVSAWFFSMLHFSYGSFSQLVFALFIGYLLGLVVKIRNLNTAIYYHFVMNLFAVVASFF